MTSARDHAATPVGLPRIGSGLDVHAFAPADRAAASAPATPTGHADAAGAAIVLAGVRIGSHAPLEGHSDADVVAHAVIDALLGAAGLGDIGERFGVDDPAVAGADSMAMLRTVQREVLAAGWRPANVDLTVVAARPRIAGHRAAMRAALAEALDLPVEAVSVKATTTDGLGSIGRGEGIAAWAVCLLGHEVAGSAE
jgi:2-C-methyl-D-erythritol 2,4-cyclodiphosphate synthase